MKTLILIASAIALGACSSTQPSGPCVCEINGHKYQIHQNAHGAVYGVPVK